MVWDFRHNCLCNREYWQDYRGFLTRSSLDTHRILTAMCQKYPQVSPPPSHWLVHYKFKQPTAMGSQHSIEDEWCSSQVSIIVNMKAMEIKKNIWFYNCKCKQIIFMYWQYIYIFLWKPWKILLLADSTSLFLYTADIVHFGRQVWDVEFVKMGLSFLSPPPLWL